MINKAIIVGRLGRDPEIRYTTGGQAVCNFTVATSERYKDKNGEAKESTEWHNIQVWGRLAEVCGEYLLKGSLVYLEGKIVTRKWEDKEGKTRYTTEIVARTMQMLGGKKESNGDAYEGGNGGGFELDESSFGGGGDEDIPF